jgi:hypothetical protein
MTSRRRFLGLGLGLGITPALGLAGSNAGAGALKQGSMVRPAPVPGGYRYMARLHRVPADLLYAVALQESQMRFGPAALPYPWTLNVRGAPRRFDSYRAAVAALADCLRRGILLVDCGLLQICWLYHHAQLRSPARALDPYPNLGVGAQLLRTHFARTGSWFRAVALYHNANPAIGERYAASVFRHLGRIPRAREAS